MRRYVCLGHVDRCGTVQEWRVQIGECFALYAEPSRRFCGGLNPRHPLASVSPGVVDYGFSDHFYKCGMVRYYLDWALIVRINSNCSHHVADGNNRVGGQANRWSHSGASLVNGD